MFSFCILFLVFLDLRFRTRKDGEKKFMNNITGMINHNVYENNINFIYPTEDTVTNEGNKLNYYCNQLSSILIHFNHLYSSDLIYGLRKSCLGFWFVRSRSISEDRNLLSMLFFVSKNTVNFN